MACDKTRSRLLLTFGVVAASGEQLEAVRQQIVPPESAGDHERQHEQKGRVCSHAHWWREESHLPGKHAHSYLHSLPLAPLPSLSWPLVEGRVSLTRQACPLPQPLPPPLTATCTPSLATTGTRPPLPLEDNSLLPVRTSTSCCRVVRLESQLCLHVSSLHCNPQPDALHCGVLKCTVFYLLELYCAM